MKCPVCGCNQFYVKDPDDEFTCYEFTIKEDQVCLSSEIDDSEAPDIENHTETYCNKCAWHDKFQALKS